jgi:hypothetical protein
MIGHAKVTLLRTYSVHSSKWPVRTNPGTEQTVDGGLFLPSAWDSKEDRLTISARISGARVCRMLRFEFSVT